jgi:ATP-dependent protease ClpP protease subunit
MSSKRVDKDHVEKWLDDGLHLPTRTLLIAGDIDDDLVTYVAQRVHVLNAAGESAPVNVLLNSSGGAVDAALVIHDLLRALNGYLTIRVTGSAASAAVVILQAGDTRELTATSSVIYHPGTSGLDATPTPEAERMWRYWQLLGSKCDDIVRERMAKSGNVLTPARFRTQVLRGLIGIGQEAVILGLADRVVGS